MKKEKPDTFEFVVGNKPGDLKASNSRRLKSHLSKRAWKAYRITATKTKTSTTTTTTTTTETGGNSSNTNNSADTAKKETKRRRSKKTQLTITYECIPHPVTYPQSQSQPVRGLLEHGYGVHGPAAETVQTQGSLQAYHSQNVYNMPLIEYQLGGGRVDPFSVYPGQRRPYVPGIIDHYIVHMAVEIPELDQPGSRGLLRSSWFPLVLSEPACFEVIVLLSASNFVSLNKLSGLADQLLQLKSNAINFINGAVTYQQKHVDSTTSSSSDIVTRGDDYRQRQHLISDGLIGAVAKMASFEAMHGDVESFKVHMEGVRRMVEMRGGLDALGLNGLLRRIIIWIDLNSSFLLKTQRVYPGQYFAIEDDTEPNPAAFTAA